MINMETQPVSPLYNLTVYSIVKKIKTTKDINNLRLPKQIEKDLKIELNKHVIMRALTLVDAYNRKEPYSTIEFANTDIATLINNDFKIPFYLLTKKDYKRLNNLMRVLFESGDGMLINLALIFLKNNQTEASMKVFFKCCQHLLNLDIDDIINNLQCLFFNDSKIEKRIIGYIINSALYSQYNSYFRTEKKKNKILDVINYFLTNSNYKITVDVATTLLYCLEENHDIAQTAKTKILQCYTSQLKNKVVRLTEVSSSKDCLQQLPQPVITKLTNVILSIDQQLKVNSVIISGLSNKIIAKKEIYYQKNSNEIFDLTDIIEYLTNTKNKINMYIKWIKKYDKLRCEILSNLWYEDTFGIIYHFKTIVCFLLKNSKMYDEIILLKLKTIFENLSFETETYYSMIKDKLKQIITNENFIRQTIESFIELDETIVSNTKTLHIKAKEIKVILKNNYIFDDSISVDEILDDYGFVKINADLLNNYFWDNFFLKTNKIKCCLIKRAYGKSGVCILENYNDIKALKSYKTKIKKSVSTLSDNRTAQQEKEIIKTILDPNASVITKMELKKAFYDFINIVVENEYINDN